MKETIRTDELRFKFSEEALERSRQHKPSKLAQQLAENLNANVERDRLDAQAGRNGKLSKRIRRP